MKICRFQTQANAPICIGLVDGDVVADVSAIAERLPSLRWPLPPGDVFVTRLNELRPDLEKIARQAERLALKDLILKSPVANPGKFLCGAGNHTDVLARGAHPRALGLLFKMTSANAGAGDGVVLRWPERTTFHEAELAIVIGREGTEIPAAEALDYVAGYAIGLDMTMQGKEFPSFGKSFDSYGVIGPWMVTADELGDPGDLAYELQVNGELRTRDSTRNLVLGVADLIEHAASVMTLHPGDVIFCGTPPAAVGPVVPGDVMDVRMDRIGAMRVAVRGGPGRKAPH